MGVTDDVVVVRGGVILDQLVEVPLLYCWIQHFFVNHCHHNCFVGVLHACRRLKVGSLCQNMTGCVVSFVNLTVRRVQTNVLRRNSVGIVEVWYVGHSAILGGRAGLHDAEHTRITVVIIVLEHSSDTQFFCVSERDLHVLCRPGDSRSFGPPGNPSPKIHTLFYPAFLAFVTCNLKQNKQNC